jgi:hypothetical protein
VEGEREGEREEGGKTDDWLYLYYLGSCFIGTDV